MAAGEGRRLRPLTERWPKPVLPIEGRPVIITLLGELAEAGIRKAWVVTGHLAEQVERLVTAAEPRVEVEFVRQPEPLGSADAVVRALAAGAKRPVLVTAADTVFEPGDVGRFLQAQGAAVAWRPRSSGTGIGLEEGRVVRIPDPGSAKYAAPLWLLTEDIDLDDLQGPPYELAEAFQKAIDAETTVRGIEIGPTRDLTEPADVVRHNFLYLENET